MFTIWAKPLLLIRIGVIVIVQIIFVAGSTIELTHCLSVAK